MARYLIVGCSGSGKSTLARRIAEIQQISYTDTDSMYWQENWDLRCDEEVVKGLPLNAEEWTIDGNFVDFRDQVWARADHIIWLNYSMPLICWRITKRNLGCWISQKPTWSGNKMLLSRCLSGIWHSFRQHSRFQKTFPGFLKDMEGKEVRVFGSPRECAQWLTQQKTRS